MGTVLSAGVSAITSTATALSGSIFEGLIGLFVGLGVIGGIVRIFR